ncbi:hypothetical protein RRF57_012748 [Xylaria bambusicola]|uniref:Pathogen-related protein n=1 Tax=Xylaria bambusicola TaxID=326684 RepID=A0AAN7V231_9PEZI
MAAEPAVPDYMMDPNAVLKDADAEWRYKQPPDYQKTRKYYSETKTRNHTAGSLPALVENLVKNWEIEASFKTQLSDWRTVDFTKYSFAVNDREPVSAEHMLRVGTYNAIIGVDAPSAISGTYYDANGMDFGTSHKTFKRMMPVFAWEVLEVYTEPPVVAFKWRHWGEFKGDYSAVNTAGEKVKVPANGKVVEITGVTVAHLNDKLQVTKLRTWFDSDEMFRQMDPDNQAVRTPMSECPIMGASTQSSQIEAGLNVA